MPQNKPPELPIRFRGLYLRGNPVARPSMTACLASNVRIMPGGGIRLRGGRKAKKNLVNSTILQLHSYRDPNFPGSNTHMAQVVTGSAAAWNWFDLATYTPDPFTSGAISVSYDSSYATSNLAAVTNTSDRPVFYNGLGVRDGTNSRPPFSSYYAGVVRYFGLDAYVPGGVNPTVAHVVGAGNNSVAYEITIWVGLYHEPTGHFSNGVKCGKVTTTAGAGTITVSNLQRLVPVYNNATEQGELKFVFYSTIDGQGYDVPYLIMNAAHTGPYTAASGSSSASLSIEIASADNDTANGFFRDLTSERPVNNFPPKPMKCIAAVNQRIYGIPLNGGSGSGSDFGYTWSRSSDLASIVWSKAPGDDRRTKQLGDPHQTWPLENKKLVPNIENPLWLAPSLGGDAVIVWTPRSVFILRELSDGLHEFNDISRLHGLGNPSTVKVTEYGICWVDQRGSICLLRGDTRSDLIVLSERSHEFVVGKTVRCANYYLDPINDIDYYKVMYSDGTFLVHDFSLRDNDFPWGMAYTGTGHDFTAAATLVAQDGTRHHVVAKGGFYTDETQPDNGLIPTTDDTFDNQTNQNFTTTEISGEYRFNWDRLTSWKQRKPLAAVFFIGDGATSAHLGSVSPISLKWWGDFQEVPGTPNTVAPVREVQMTTDWSYRCALLQSSRFFFKIGFTLAGHSSDDSDFTYHRRPAVEGDLDKNFYGSIWEAAYLIGDENT